MRFVKNSDFNHLKEVTSLGLINSKTKSFDPKGIFSPEIFGSKDYSCECGALKAAWHTGEICPKCNTTISDPKDNIYKNGRFKLPNGLKIFNPVIYLILSKYVKIFQYKINPQNKHIDINGHIIYQNNDGIELLDITSFIKNYHETILKLIPDEDIVNDEKLERFREFLLENEDSVMLESIPLLPTHLRPSELCEKNIYLEPLNKLYIAINTHLHSLKNNADKDDLMLVEQELFRVQELYIELYDKVIELISSKEGLARDQVLSNKINFSGRAVITVKDDNDPTSVTLPHILFTEIYLPKILTYIVEQYNYSYTDALDYYNLNRFNYNDNIILEAIDTILLTKPKVLINRNPSLHLLSIQSFFVSGVTKDYTIKLTKPSLQSLNADFDTLNQRLV